MPDGNLLISSVVNVAAVDNCSCFLSTSFPDASYNCSIAVPPPIAGMLTVTGPIVGLGYTAKPPAAGEAITSRICEYWNELSDCTILIR